MSNRLQIFILFLSQFLVITCLDMTDPYWPLIIQHLANSTYSHSVEYWTTLICMAPFFVTIFTAPVWGSIGKKYGYKKMLIRASLVLALTQLLLFITHDLVAILTLRLIQGAFAGFTAAAQAWLVFSSEENKHGYYIGKVQAFIAMGTIVGPVVGGVIARYSLFSNIFLISGIICIFVTLLLLLYLTETKKMPVQKLNKFSVTQLKNISFSSLFWLAFIFLTQALRWMSASFFALFVAERIGGDSITIGILYGVIAIMIYISAPWCGGLSYRFKDNFGLLKFSILICLALAALSQIIYAELNTMFIAIVASCVWGVCLGAMSSLPFSMLIQQTPAKDKGLMIGFSSSASKMGNLVGIGIGGSIYAISSLSVAFASIAIGYITTFVFVWFALKNPLTSHIAHYRSDNIQNSE